LHPGREFEVLYVVEVEVDDGCGIPIGEIEAGSTVPGLDRNKPACAGTCGDLDAPEAGAVLDSLDIDSELSCQFGVSLQLLEQLGSITDTIIGIGISVYDIVLGYVVAFD
jgi:hypothetical protein